MIRFLLCLLLLPFFLFAQESNNTRYQTSNFDRDTLAISNLLSRAKALRHQNDDSCLSIYTSALRKSRQIKYIQGVARAMTGLGLTYMDKGDYNKSMAIYKAAEPYCKLASEENGRYITVLYNNIAALYGNRGVSDSAAIYYYKALEQMELKKVNDTNLLLFIYSNLAGRLLSNDQNEQAKIYLDKAFPIALRKAEPKILAKFYIDFGALYGAEKKSALSREYSNKALAIFKTVKDPASEIAAYCNIGKTLLDEKQPQEALKYYRKGFAVKGSKIQKSSVYRGLGQCSMALKDYKKAEDYYLKALNISKEEKLYKGMRECYKALVDVNVGLGNYKAALNYRNAFAQLEDSTSNAEKLATVNQLEIKYRTSQKDKELAQQQLLLAKQNNKLKQQRIWIGFISAVSILLIGLIGSTYRNRRSRERMQQIKMEKEHELSQLKAVMEGEERERERIARELHDGIMVQFSSAQMNLSAMIERGEIADTSELESILVQLENATKELRKSAHNLMPDMLLQEGLAAATHYFCKTLQRSTGIKIEFHLIGIIPLIAPEYELMLYRMIQELLHNMLKHARASYALVQINCHTDILTVVVEDNGVGIDENAANSKGMGIANIKARIHSLNGHFSLTSNLPSGTSVYIELETKLLQSLNTLVNAN